MGSDRIGMQSDVILASVREAFPELIAVYLFGSVAAGDSTSESDLDLGLLGHEPLPIDGIAALREKLAGAIGRDVDLVDPARATTVFRAHGAPRNGVGARDRSFL